jgi:hypothetical protein
MNSLKNWRKKFGHAPEGMTSQEKKYWYETGKDPRQVAGWEYEKGKAPKKIFWYETNKLGKEFWEKQYGNKPEYNPELRRMNILVTGTPEEKEIERKYFLERYGEIPQITTDKNNNIVSYELPKYSQKLKQINLQEQAKKQKYEINGVSFSEGIVKKVGGNTGMSAIAQDLLPTDKSANVREIKIPVSDKIISDEELRNKGLISKFEVTRPIYELNSSSPNYGKIIGYEVASEGGFKITPAVIETKEVCHFLKISTQLVKLLTILRVPL